MIFMEENNKTSIGTLEGKIEKRYKEDEDKIKMQEKLDSLSAHRRKVELELKEHSEIIRMRSYWSSGILIVILFIVLFDFYVIVDLKYK